MSATRSTAIPTLGSQLERDRLEYRVTRASLAIVDLRRNANEHQRERQAERLRQAIADFEAQVAAMNARLRDLASEPVSTQAQQFNEDIAETERSKR
jgi:hypothetical protein